MSHKPSVNGSEVDQLAENISEPFQNNNYPKNINKSHSDGLSNNVKEKQKAMEILHY